MLRARGNNGQFTGSEMGVVPSENHLPAAQHQQPAIILERSLAEMQTPPSGMALMMRPPLEQHVTDSTIATKAVQLLQNDSSQALNEQDKKISPKVKDNKENKQNKQKSGPWRSRSKQVELIEPLTAQRTISHSHS